MKFFGILLALLSAVSVSSFAVPSSHVVNTRVSTTQSSDSQKTTVRNLAELSDDTTISSVSSLVAAADTIFKSGSINWKAAAGTSVMAGGIVGLLVGWQKMTKYFYLRQPPSFRPVQESIFNTLAGLGVVGVSLNLILGVQPVQKSLTTFSKDFFGKPDILVENVMFLHDAIFQLGVAFAICAGLMLIRGERKLIDIASIQEEQIDPQTGIYRLTAENLARYIKIREFNRPQEQPGYIGIQREIFMDTGEWSAKILLLRSHVMDLFPSLPADFRVEALMEEDFAANMYKAVQVPFFAWALYIPALAISNSIDLSHGVVNSGAANDAASAGYFFDEFFSFVPSISSVIIGSIWGWWNCWKMTQVKYMILPRLEPDQANDGMPVIRPPPMYNDYVRSTFDASPPSLRRVERFWGKEPQTIYDDLFGQAGSAGLELYGNSIKYQFWLTLTNVVYFGLQILPRDLEVFVNGAKAGDPTNVSVELWFYAIMMSVSLINLFLVTPRTFWNYSLVSCMEGENLVELLRLSGYGTPQQVAQPRTSTNPSLPMGGGPPGAAGRLPPSNNPGGTFQGGGGPGGFSNGNYVDSDYRDTF
ncbi:expressed unknown protein [Seminavis robusta]|uniref:Uncharacterized protein n=1 Tax=Seminavis robusta TaxID=568900 RepID=A0A9N8DQV2_9STRA|nr:expressed unknown protein [Seminavis robusta]|eukprot:Sro306_g113100.1 n/a (588) ;mRNA; r:63966-65729